MKATTCPIYRWRVGEVEIIRVLEFEAALFEPAVIHPAPAVSLVRKAPFTGPADFEPPRQPEHS